MNNACDEINRKRDIGQSLKEKYKGYRRITSTQIIHHNGSHAIGKDLLEDTLRRFQVKEYEINAGKLTCDAMYIKMWNSGWCTFQDNRYREYES